MMQDSTTIQDETGGAETTRAPLVRIESVTKRFGDVTAVDGVTLDIGEGEFFALLGPSGCGKTTLLRMLAGFENPDHGRILLDGRDIVDVPPHRRPVNMMFQSYALFPHLSVAGNVAFGLKQEALPKSEIEVRVAEMLALVRLEGLGTRKPHQLSGGQRQRVALARALVKRPRLLLLDEPLSALDRKLREETRAELMELQTRLGLTFVVVTHDQDEAMSMAGRIGVMNHGRLVQCDAPAEVYEHPASRWVADFVGDVNLIEAHVVEFRDGEVALETSGGSRFTASAAESLEKGAAVCIAVRPEKVGIGTQSHAGSDNAFAGTVVDIGYLGDVSVHRVRLDNGLMMKATIANRTRSSAPRLARGDRVWIDIPSGSALVLTR